jgi:asparagine synthase (glutamine-hydrolysing)
MVMPTIAHWFAPVLNMIYRPAAYALLKHARADSWHIDYINHNALFSQSQMAHAAPKLKGLFDPELFLNKFYHLKRIKSTTSAFLYFDFKTRMADLYTMQNEKLTAAFDLDWYSPFLNRNVVEFAASLPEAEDLTEDQSAMYLKDIFKNLLPDSVLQRPKKSRPDLLKNWLTESELPDLFRLLLKGTLVEEGYVSEEWLRQHLATPEIMAGSFRELWAILALETWFRIFINKAIEEVPPEVTLRELLSED